MTGGKCTLGALYAEVKAALREGCRDGQSPWEAAYLFAHVFGTSPRDPAFDGSAPADAAQAVRLHALAARRLGGEPLQYLLGVWEFYGLPFAVGPGVLIPRPETELVVDLTLARLGAAGHLLDLCSGSGCVAIAAAAHRPRGHCWAVEHSPAAFGYMERNIALNCLSNITPILGDALAAENWRPHLPGYPKMEIITCNPPYLTGGEMKALPPEVTHEPVMALAGGADGLDFYRVIPTLYRDMLLPGGTLLMEIGWEQGEAVQDLFSEAGYENVTVHKDLSGQNRVVSGRV